MWLTRRPVKLQRSSLFHLDTGGILAGRLVSSLSHGHGPHLDFGHSDPQLTSTPGYFTAPHSGWQPELEGLDARTSTGASASDCTAAARMALDSGSRWNRDFADSSSLEIGMVPVFTQLEGSSCRALNCSHPSD